MSITVKVYQGDDAAVGANLAISAMLYVPGWTLRKRLYSVVNGTHRGIVALAFKDDKPVAVVLVRATRGGETTAFTRKSERRQGLASMCVTALRDAGVGMKHASCGIVGSTGFWMRHQIVVR